ncbi:hypothetical protein ACFSFZ_08120 [Mixta tenebrionis]|jgi:hypothetical protein|uniref:ParE-like toxin domain-containing protein n=2 Tax=Mixta TaxID=2100764 RepID=A0A6P1Q3N0_9GAMM|nr:MULTISPECIES: hypothetical protein [Mixta]QHM72657.1 hypothetical protein C7M51_02975 [Mixta intestinalis]TPW40882.1 hypothetical protein FKM52_17025 [Mixta tenebrionis]
MKLITIGPGLRALPGIPVRYCKKARRQIQLFRCGTHNYKRLEDRGCGYFKIDIGPFWRLLSRNNGRTWLLLSHERYNREIRK